MKLLKGLIASAEAWLMRTSAPMKRRKYFMFGDLVIFVWWFGDLVDKRYDGGSAMLLWDIWAGGKMCKCLKRKATGRVMPSKFISMIHCTWSFISDATLKLELNLCLVDRSNTRV